MRHQQSASIKRTQEKPTVTVTKKLILNFGNSLS
uniref:Uncharacterized protein n=1 Tax=Anguilla anguilla TaxID=7936 RepID=A0A0E9V101_ANGAN